MLMLIALTKLSVVARGTEHSEAENLLNAHVVSKSNLPIHIDVSLPFFKLSKVFLRDVQNTGERNVLFSPSGEKSRSQPSVTDMSWSGIPIERLGWPLNQADLKLCLNIPSGSLSAVKKHGVNNHGALNNWINNSDALYSEISTSAMAL